MHANGYDELTQLTVLPLLHCTYLLQNRIELGLKCLVLPAVSILTSF